MLIKRHKYTRLEIKDKLKMKRNIAAVALSMFLMTAFAATAQETNNKPYYKIDSFVNSIAICGDSLYAAASDGVLRTISALDGAITKEYAYSEIDFPTGKHSPSVYFVTCEPVKGYVAATSSGGELTLFDNHLKVISTFKIPEAHSYSAVFTSSENILLSTVNGSVYSLVIPELKQIWKIKANWDSIKTIVASPDGALFATGSNDSRIYIRNSRNGEKVKTLRGHKDGIYSISWSADGKNLLSGSKDRRLLYWDLEKELYLELHKDFTYIYAVIIADNKLAISTTSEKEISIFSLDNQIEIATIKGSSTVVGALAYQDKSLFSSSNNGEIYKTNISKYLTAN